MKGDLAQGPGVSIVRPRVAYSNQDLVIAWHRHAELGESQLSGGPTASMTMARIVAGYGG
jgi:hypothetical protein